MAAIVEFVPADSEAVALSFGAVLRGEEIFLGHDA
jgi:hypothetical protein